MTEQPQRTAGEREEIAARVANFRATQEKFAREREEFFTATLDNARHSSERPRCLNAPIDSTGAVEKNQTLPEQNRRNEVFLSSAATSQEVKA